MAVESEIPIELVRAYAATDYHVFGEPPFSLHIEQQSEDLLRLYQRFHVSNALFLTACNPWSHRSPDAANAVAHAMLVAEIERRKLIHLPGQGVDPEGRWPAESSLLIMGVTLETARALGRQFKQNAVVWAAADAVPRLILLK
jgi:hypothetical protein